MAGKSLTWSFVSHFLAKKKTGGGFQCWFMSTKTVTTMATVQFILCFCHCKLRRNALFVKGAVTYVSSTYGLLFASAVTWSKQIFTILWSNLINSMARGHVRKLTRHGPHRKYSRCLATIRGLLPSRCLATIGGCTDTHTHIHTHGQQRDLISLLYFFKIEK
jgi:hypothetical protein